MQMGESSGALGPLEGYCLLLRGDKARALSRGLDSAGTRAAVNAAVSEGVRQADAVGARCTILKDQVNLPVVELPPARRWTL
jgi:hypothetical protein